ncbi:hypothetical protein KCG44_00025 [Pacificimonas sp. WHA3]|uniref:Peptidase M15A C-terminal domain-containing protein n=1 Tax=Pacificimonas pallii TaxID=2827236 RepID=A0ABS6S9Y1_9SPHN|nr:D-Ala-D-Ala carboxypeptidase family metallohydrolase [Pacificimonas pallii]MBV7255162.1 hypothetical protein [Pacificimonas pallii]
MKRLLMTIGLVMALCQPFSDISGARLSGAAQAAEPGADEYAVWLREPGNRERVRLFEEELAKRDLLGVVPTYQILRTALSWRSCRASPFALPDRQLWDGAFRSLKVLKTEIVPRIGPVSIVSGYRHATLNECAGGAARSVHREFGAFDVFAIGALSRDDMIEHLCAWHDARGADLSAGLGIYQLKKFHIDVGLRGYRRWGSDYTIRSAPCAV